MGNWAGRVTIVTGASSGIGRQVALDLAGRGATVVAVARRADRLEELVAGCRRSADGCWARPADLADPEVPAAVVREVEERHGRVDVVVNNAAIPMRVHGTRLTVGDVEAAMAVNFLAPVRLALAALPGMLGRGAGHIVNVASVAGRVGSPRESAYSASKFALVGWSEAMASDLVGTGVRVHLVIPGPIDTEIWDKVTEPPAYRGRRYPPAIVSRAVLDCVERGAFERWAPRWLSVMPLFRSLTPRAYVTLGGVFDRRAAGRGR